MLRTANWNSSRQCQYTLCWEIWSARRKIGFAKALCFCSWNSFAMRLAASNLTSSNPLIASDSFHWNKKQMSHSEF